MSEGQLASGNKRSGLALALLALGLLVGAWTADLAGRAAVSRLDLDRFGPGDDVSDSLTREAVAADTMLPYLRAAIVLDGLALVFSVASSLRAVLHRGPWAVGAVIMVPACLSLGLHGLNWVITSFFEA